MGIDFWTVTLAATITAIMTGAGVLPFLFVRKISDHWIGWANGLAAGLMLSASHALITEAVTQNVPLAILGMLLGLAAIMLANRFVSVKKDVKIADLSGVKATQAFLILAIMTAHSFAEGIGIGVSFGGAEDLGIYITTAIAFHNVPEGLAIALVLISRGVSPFKTALWAIFTSLPQPLMAAPAFLFVETFRPFLPVGLGLAAGAMIWMVFAELVPDALEKAPPESVATSTTLGFTAMLAFQLLVLAT